MLGSVADIYLLGSGMCSFLDITLSTQDILRRCAEVYSLHDLPSLERYLAKVCRKTRNLLPVYYRDGRERAEIYHDVARHVIDAAQRERPVALLMHGHPLVYSAISRLIIDGAAHGGLQLEVLPAVSSLDRMFVDLRLDIAVHGVQVYLASMAVERNIPLNPGADCILFQVGHLFSHLSQRLVPTAPEEIDPLSTYLRRFYPATHLVQVVECAVELGVQGRVTPSSIAELSAHHQAFNYNASLHIPPVLTV